MHAIAKQPSKSPKRHKIIVRSLGLGIEYIQSRALNTCQVQVIIVKRTKTSTVTRAKVDQDLDCHKVQILFTLAGKTGAIPPFLPGSERC